MGGRYRRGARGPRPNVVALVIAIAILAVTAPAGSFTTADFPRSHSTDVVTDDRGVVALAVAAEVTVGTTSWFLDVANHYDESLSVTITLDSTAGVFADLVVNGTNQGDVATFSLASGTNESVDLQVANDCTAGGSPVPFGVVASTAGFAASANRSSAVGEVVGLRDSVAFQTQATNELSTLDRAGVVTGLGVTTKGFGPADADFDCDGLVEVPYVDGVSGISIIDVNGEVQQLVTGGVVNDIVLGVGDFDEDGNPDVIYPNANDGGELYRVSYGGSPVKLPGAIRADSVVGITDLNNDGDADVVYLDKNKVLYYDDGNAFDLGVKSKSQMSIGAPRDFNGDGVERVPYVSDKSNEILLVDANGTTQVVRSGADTTLGSLGTFDWNDDGTPDIVIVYNADKKLYWIDYATGSQNGPLQDDGGVDVEGDNYGVA